MLDGPEHRLADQIELADQRDPRLYLRQFGLGQDVVEDAAGVGQSDDNNIVWRGNIVGKNDIHDAELDFLLRFVVDDRIAPGTGYPAGERKQAAVVVFYDAVRY